MAKESTGDAHPNFHLLFFGSFARMGSAQFEAAMEERMNDPGKTYEAQVRENFIPDFSNWKSHDAFASAFARLLKDLKADTTAA